MIFTESGSGLFKPFFKKKKNSFTKNETIKIKFTFLARKFKAILEKSLEKSCNFDLILDCDWMRSIDPDPDIFIILQQMCLQKCNLKNHHIPKNERGSNFVINHWSKVTATIFCTFQLRCKSSGFFANFSIHNDQSFLIKYHENVFFFRRGFWQFSA